MPNDVTLSYIISSKTLGNNTIEYRICDTVNLQNKVPKDHLSISVISLLYGNLPDNSDLLAMTSSMSTHQTFSPEEHKQSFRVGFTRKPIHFVPAAVARTQAKELTPQTSPICPGDRFLNIVRENSLSNSTYTESKNIATDQQYDLEGAFCEICNLPIDFQAGMASTAIAHHEATIAHMVCLSHSYPPSHLDRSRQGFKYLSAYGWDPDSRQGLGATGEGIRAPIKAKIKNDTVGIGVEVKGNRKHLDPKVEKMNAKQIRKKDAGDRRKWERLQEMFYGNDDIEKYLGAK